MAKKNPEKKPGDDREALEEAKRRMDEYYEQHNWLKEFLFPDPDDFVLALYKKSRPMVRHVMKRYLPLMSIADEDDLWQDAFEALLEALRTFDPRRSSRQISTHYHYWLQKTWSKSVMKEYVVDVYTTEGVYVKTIEYSTYLKTKRRLDAQGMVYKFRKRLMNFDADE